MRRLPDRRFARPVLASQAESARRHHRANRCGQCSGLTHPRCRRGRKRVGPLWLLGGKPHRPSARRTRRVQLAPVACCAIVMPLRYAGVRGNAREVYPTQRRNDRRTSVRGRSPRLKASRTPRFCFPIGRINFAYLLLRISKQRATS